MKDNRVVSRGIAIIGGVQTGLAGCNNPSCTWNCIRKHKLLPQLLQESEQGCKLYIPAGEASADEFK